MTAPRSRHAAGKATPEDEEFAARVRRLPMSRRAASALDVLLERGTITTSELKDMGYDHPPRAIADLKDAGVGVETAMVVIAGRRMARYALADRDVSDGAGGRKTVSRAFRASVYEAHRHRCAMCGAAYQGRELQLDHRIPFRIAGDPPDPAIGDFMPLCGPDNRAKSWSCEHCGNWEKKLAEVCRSCYWASPESYTHIAETSERRLAVTVRGEQVPEYDAIARHAEQAGTSVQEWVRARLSRLVDEG